MKINNTPTWHEDIKKVSSSSLKEDIEADVAIVGGGITGILFAYLLCKGKKRVVILDKESVAGKGAVTAYTTAHMTQIIDTDYSELIEMIGKRNAKLVWKSHEEAIDLIEGIVTKEEIGCEFKRVPAYKYINDPKDFKYLEEEVDAISELGGKTTLHRSISLGIKQYGALEIPHQAEFSPIKFISSLAEVLKKRGVVFYDKTEVKKVEEEKDGVTVYASNGSVYSEYVLFATYWPFHKHRDLFAKKGEYTSYVYEVEVPKKTVPEGLYWDMENPYHYTRVDSYKTFDRLIIGGEDHRAELPIKAQKNYNALKKYIQHILPQTRLTFTRKWNGPILEPIDGLAFIGELSDRQLIGTAFSGNGMTYAGIAANILTDHILKKKNKYAEIYRPHRIPGIKSLFQKGKDYTGEFFGGAARNIFQ